MKRTPSVVVVTAVLLILALGLVACGGGTPAEAAPPPTGTGDPVAGERIYASVCTTCHGPEGEGIAGLSKDMTQSELVAGKTDQELVEFIKLGGAPGEPLVMLPKAGNPALTDENLRDVVAYVRGLQKCECIQFGDSRRR